VKNKATVIKTGFLFLSLLLITSFFPVKGVDYEDITPQEAKRRIDLDPTIFILDVRSSIEYRDGHLDGAVNINVYYINSYAYLLPENNETGIIVYCDDGYRSQTGSEKVCNLGYTNVSNMLDGFYGWIDLGYPFIIGTGTSLTTTAVNFGLVNVLCISIFVLVVWRTRILIKKP
jgi:rhodanese-related sulfurtransferase